MDKDIIEDITESVILSGFDSVNDAFLYGITIGWEDDLKEELNDRFGWTNADWEKIESIRRHIESLK